MRAWQRVLNEHILLIFCCCYDIIFQQKEMFMIIENVIAKLEGLKKDIDFIKECL